MVRIAVISFPGNNCEVETLRSLRRVGMEPVSFRWNDDVAKLEEIDAYMLPGGFSYEDRGRAGMIAGRDPLLAHLKQEAADGKAVIGNCNGAQVLVESGLIPFGDDLSMCLARNVTSTEAGPVAAGFLGEWIWITPTCAPDRCVTANWQGTMHIPIAHGEGRFVSKNPEVIPALKENNQIVFRYCDANGNIAEDATYNPNGSTDAIAGICNPAGNVVALMPHPERTPLGDPYFRSMKEWVEQKKRYEAGSPFAKGQTSFETLPDRSFGGEAEIFIDTIIVNNEERTVEQAARRVLPDLSLKQLRYVGLASHSPQDILGTIALFNPRKEVAYVRRGNEIKRWNSDAKREEDLSHSPLAGDITLLRRDEPDVGGAALGEGNQTGICYVCSNVKPDDVLQPSVLEVFANPHASTLERM